MESAARDPIRPSISPEEEALKRNTDCVYFLASPLTCKKGNECEYRHSEGARVNPRDCWYWLNGNCLNPKCSFRHPPLDGLIGSPMAAASGPVLPSVQSAKSTQVPAAYSPSAHTSNKQGIPCYFFLKGSCLKGDRCPYMHEVQPVNSSTPQQAGKVAVPSTETSNTSKNPSWTLEKCVQQNKQEIRAEKSVEAPSSLAKTNTKAETTPANGFAVKMLPTPLTDEMPHGLQPNNVACSIPNFTDRPQSSHSQPVDECIQNGREADDSLRESSPGFDVLVDNELEETDYFHKDDDDEIGGTSDYGGKIPNMVNDFDYPHSSDYDSVTKFKRETYNEIVEYDHHGRRDWYSQEHHRSSEGTKRRSSMPERKGLCRENSPDNLDASDLRHRLLKQRRLNGPRSAINPDHCGEPYQQDDQHIEDQRFQGHNSQRNQRNVPHESSISNRLQGRITLPGRPADNFTNLHSEGLINRGRDWGRSSSPGQPPNFQGRHHDTIKLRVQKDYTAEARNLASQIRRQDEEDSLLNFAGPKSLAELKGAKFSGKSEVTLTRIDNSTITREPKKSEGSLSFEGPKPLSVILKRKREVSPGNDAVSGNGPEDDHRVVKGNTGDLMTPAIADNKTIHPLESENGESHTLNHTEPIKSTTVVEEDEEEEGLIVSDGEELHQGQSSPKGEMLSTEDDKLADNMEDPEVKNNERDEESKCEAAEGTGFKLTHPDQSSHKGEMLKTEDGMLIDSVDNPELQDYDQRDEELEYETTDGTNFKTDDGEYVYEEDEDADDDDDDDGDDFARKLGVMLT